MKVEFIFVGFAQTSTAVVYLICALTNYFHKKIYIQHLDLLYIFFAFIDVHDMKK